MTTLEKYNLLKPNYFNLGLRYENNDKTYPRYFCTPKNAFVFASMGYGGIHYCFID